MPKGHGAGRRNRPKTPENPTLQRYHEGQLQATLVIFPYRVLVAVSLQRAATGRAEEAKREVISRLALFPNDPEYLEGALKVASSIRDEKWMGELSEHIKGLFDKRPYDIALYSLNQLVLKCAGEGAPAGAVQIVQAS